LEVQHIDSVDWLGELQEPSRFDPL
jgi:hypothetical protein